MKTHTLRYRLLAPLPVLLLTTGLLLCGQGAEAFFSQAQPPSGNWVANIWGCQPECAGNCGHTEYEMGAECGSGCFCCGCINDAAQLNYWNASGGTCLHDSGGGCTCASPDVYWGGYYSGTSAHTTADCG